MNIPVHEQQMFEHVTCNIAAEEDEITTPACLSLETIEQVSMLVSAERYVVMTFIIGRLSIVC